MSTTITNANLTVTISENIMLNNQPINSENQLIVSGINEVSKRIVTVPLANEVSIILFGTEVAAGTFIRTNIRYIRITNKDNLNFVRLQVLKTGSAEFNIRLDAGQSFILGNTKESVSATGGVFTAFLDADFIMAQADTANVDIELFIAST